MAVISEGNRLHDVLAWEQEFHYSREKVTILSGENLSLGEVVGKVARSTPTTGTADGGNTGDGTCTGVAAGSETQEGTYTLECVTAAANGGTFKVVAPDGDALPDAEVGTAYVSEQLNCTINDGAADFVVGDKFTIAVAAGSGKYVALDPSAIDGSEDAAGIVIADYDATSGDIEGVIIIRDAVLREGGVVWPSGIAANDKTAAIAQLEAIGIIIRAET